MNLINLLLIVVSVSLNAIAQLAIKAGANAISSQVTQLTFIQLASRTLLQPWIILGLVFYAFSVGIWIVVLAKVPVSIAYPMLSIGYVLNVFLAYYFFNESLSLAKLLGVAIIIVGVIVLATSRS